MLSVLHSLIPSTLTLSVWAIDFFFMNDEVVKRSSSNAAKLTSYRCNPSKLKKTLLLSHVLIISSILTITQKNTNAPRLVLLSKDKEENDDEKYKSIRLHRNATLGKKQETIISSGQRLQDIHYPALLRASPESMKIQKIQRLLSRLGRGSVCFNGNRHFLAHVTQCDCTRSQCVCVCVCV